MTPIGIEVENPDQLEVVAQKLLSLAGERRKFTLEGDLGAGKTTLVKALCAALGVKEPVSSPSFSIVNEYHAQNTDDDTEQPVYHMDLYRLKTLEEALDIGIAEYLESPYYCFIEWPELILPLLGPEVFRIRLEIVGDSARKILLL